MGRAYSYRDRQLIKAAEKQRKALEARKAGHTYPEIAKMCGYKSEQYAYEAVKTAIHKIIKEPAKEVLALETQRLDKLMLGCWKVATSGDLRAIDRVVRIMERRANLLGLDAPRKSEAQVQQQDTARHVVKVVLNPEVVAALAGQGSGETEE